MRALVTGAAGFIGSTLVDRLLADGHEVVGVDCFTPYYDRLTKESNLSTARNFNRFKFHEIDLTEQPLEAMLEGVTDIFHQAGQPGVRASWGRDFSEYVRLNILATQRLLEAAKTVGSLKSFVAASSSSVYGSTEESSTSESAIPKPISPYGVTKLSSENLCTLYGTQYGLPTVSLRYFTVYGPRQRPDMAIHRMIMAGLTRSQFVIFGNGAQERDFTYVQDVVEANLLAASSVATGQLDSRVFNIGSQSPISVNQLLEVLQRCIGHKIFTTNVNRELGDPQRTYADASLAHSRLNWSQTIDIENGLQKQVNHLSRLS